MGVQVGPRGFIVFDLKCKVRNGSILGTCEHFITRVGVNNVYDRFVTRVHPVTRSVKFRAGALFQANNLSVKSRGPLNVVRLNIYVIYV